MIVKYYWAILAHIMRWIYVHLLSHSKLFIFLCFYFFLVLIFQKWLLFFSCVFCWILFLFHFFLFLISFIFFFTLVSTNSYLFHKRAEAVASRQPFSNHIRRFSVSDIYFFLLFFLNFFYYYFWLMYIYFSYKDTKLFCLRSMNSFV